MRCGLVHGTMPPNARSRRKNPPDHNNYLQIVSARADGTSAAVIAGNGNAPSTEATEAASPGSSVPALSYAIGDVLALEARNLSSPFCEAFFTERVS